MVALYIEAYLYTYDTTSVPKWTTLFCDGHCFDEEEEVNGGGCWCGASDPGGGGASDPGGGVASGDGGCEASKNEEPPTTSSTSFRQDLYSPTSSFYINERSVSLSYPLFFLVNLSSPNCAYIHCNLLYWDSNGLLNSGDVKFILPQLS